MGERRDTTFESLGLDPRLQSFLFPRSRTFTDQKKPPTKPSASASRLEIVSHIRAREQENYDQAPIMAGKDWKSMDGVVIKKTSIPGPADSKVVIPIDVYTPSQQTSTSPAGTVVFYHGGGMMIYSKNHPVYVRTAKELARGGLRVVVPEFRSAIDAPFPCGLLDCYETMLWAARKFGPVVLFGDSGGGNLSYAVTLLAKRRSQLSLILGTYTLAPYVWGTYPAPQFPSLAKYDSLTYTRWLNTHVARLYTTNKKDAKSGLAWPAQACLDELKGLPPTVIHCNEFDMLLDSAVYFHKQLLRAGVKSTYVLSKGTCHDADIWFGLMPELTRALVEKVRIFVIVRTHEEQQ
mmetsp:Transcript_20505/g.41326  ORF Transcript_20505/g.41326 Transcript_20505/m.41326 type:complete len:349 (-) Transcript_20505:357-1403(-)|eukprot:CAMPEP_0167776366 /NCGR_PEP_ID=MMETSP0111_2-20121227/3083_1 /TAXON_ID=91324 /ORGANISM="Lotharella globosa, Strain CCCM811" /LENGTH=348 /DNA_ID=CAMNT_0007666401 /DNA_START=111 /DNA_END=1157 /DNA_ORIENTATION=-